MYINGYFKVVDGQTSGEETERGKRRERERKANGTKVESEEETTEGDEYEGEEEREPRGRSETKICDFLNLFMTE